jgi:uncharacterized protein (UPF0218 family)
MASKSKVRRKRVRERQVAMSKLVIGHRNPNGTISILKYKYPHKPQKPKHTKHKTMRRRK